MLSNRYGNGHVYETIRCDWTTKHNIELHYSQLIFIIKINCPSKQCDIQVSVEAMKKKFYRHRNIILSNRRRRTDANKTEARELM